MKNRANILKSHGIRTVELNNGILIADSSKEENGKVYEISKMTEKEFWKFLGY